MFFSAAKREQSFQRAVVWTWQGSRANLWVNINFHHHKVKLKAAPACNRDVEQSRSSKSQDGKRLLRGVKDRDNCMCSYTGEGFCFLGEHLKGFFSNNNKTIVRSINAFLKTVITAVSCSVRREHDN